MSRPSMLISAFVVVLAFCNAGVSAADDELVDSAAYKSWAKHKPGTQVVSDMKTSMGAFSSTGELTSKLLEVHPDRVVIESTTVVNVPGVPGKPTTKKVELMAKVPKKDADKDGLPEGMTGTVKPIADEQVTAAGKEYECKVVEFDGSREGMQAKGKSWRSEEVPGMMVKIEMKASAGGNPVDMAVTLKKVELK